MLFIIFYAKHIMDEFNRAFEHVLHNTNNHGHGHGHGHGIFILATHLEGIYHMAPDHGE